MSDDASLSKTSVKPGERRRISDFFRIEATQAEEVDKLKGFMMRVHGDTDLASGAPSSSTPSPHTGLAGRGRRSIVAVRKIKEDATQRNVITNR